MSISELKSFYDQVDHFKHSIIHILESLGKTEEIKRINIHYDKLLMVKSVNARGIVSVVYEKAIHPCVEAILLKQESFFLGKLDKVNTIQQIDDNDIMFIEQIAGIWPLLPNEVKDNIWKYILVLSILAERIVGGSVLKDTREQLKQSGALQ